MYLDIAKGWAIEALKVPLIAIISESHVNIDFRGFIDVQEKHSKYIKIQSYLKTVLRSLIESSTAEIMPLALLDFIRSLFKPNEFIPNHFLSPFEIFLLPVETYQTGRIPRNGFTKEN